MDRIQLGIDENGLGSRLGPLIVTAVAARIHGPTAAARQAGQVDRSRLLDDSKRLVSHQNVRLGEAWARAIVGAAATSPAALLEQVSLDPIAVSMKPCPAHVKSQCWGTDGEAFTASEPMVEEVTHLLQTLRQRGLEICSVRSAWSCTRVLNDRLALGQHRFIVDLHNMERLILDARKRMDCQIDAICGKVGGIADYPRYFGPLAGRLYAVIEQSRERSSYEFAQLGQVAFEQDADAHDSLVMIASLVGKYLRELFMGRIARHYANSDRVARPPSGYHDPVTNQFVEATSVLRKSRRVPLDCFERRRNR